MLQIRSIKTKYNRILRQRSCTRCRDRYGTFLLRKEAPWFNAAAVEFLDTLDLSAYTFFEFGSGTSTLYFSSKCLGGNSYEQNSEYFEFTRKLLDQNEVQNVNLQLYLTSDVNHILHNQQIQSSILILDDTNRGTILKNLSVMDLLPPIIIFDNSDWMPNHLSLLLDRFFIINFIDFPRRARNFENFKINHFSTQTTIALSKFTPLPDQISRRVSFSPIPAGKVQSKKSRLLDIV